MSIKIFWLPCKAIAQLHELPTAAGVYYMTAFWQTFYVGKALSLRQRLRKSHHRYKQLKLLAPFARVHYRVLPKAEIASYENKEIKRLKPSWNNTKVPNFWQLVPFCLGIWLRLIIYILLPLVAIGYVIWCVIWLILQ